MAISRRDFMQASAGAVTALGLGSLGGGCQSNESVDSAANDRLAVTMWEFSWLVRRTGAEAEYADWDRVLDELAQRGYNCIRLDAFPHLIAAGSDGEVVDTFTILPQTPLFFWGNHEPVQVEPRRSLVEFLKKMRARGMKAGLSTWFNDDDLHRADSVVTPADYARVWRETLDFLADEGLHDLIAWVDLCNEFPMGKWARGAYPAIFDGAEADNPGPAIAPWSDDAHQKVQSYFDEAIPALRSAYPDLRYTFSLAAAAIERNADRLDTKQFDLAEIHIWLSDDPNFLVNSGQLNLLLEKSGSLEHHVETAPKLYFAERQRWLDSLNASIKRWKRWADERGLPVITSESWGPVNYADVAPIGDTSEWEWVKDICAEGVRMAVDHGWSGICTSNFCQPHFESMWADASWHQRLTKEILGA